MPNQDQTPLGPQGTQMFDRDDVNKMIAQEIVNSQSPTAATPALIGISPNVSGEQFILTKGKIEVGRRPNSDIVLDLSSVSAMHAQIIKQGDQWKLLNLLSSNGTFINDEKIAEKIIKPGDRIGFAEAEFVFTYVDESPLQKTSSKKTPLIILSLTLAAIAVGVYFAFIK